MTLENGYLPVPPPPDDTRRLDVPPPPPIAQLNMPSGRGYFKIVIASVFVLVVVIFGGISLVGNSLRNGQDEFLQQPVSSIRSPRCLDLLPLSAFESITGKKAIDYSLDETYTESDGAHLIRCIYSGEDVDLNGFVYFVSWQDVIGIEDSFLADKAAFLGPLDRQNNQSPDAFQEVFSLGASAYWSNHQLRILSSNRMYYVLISSQELLNAVGLETQFEALYLDIAQEIDNNSSNYPSL